MKKVLFVTRPISLPWDEASKNFTRDLVSRLKKVLPVTLTDRAVDEIPANVEQLELYTGSELTNRQKLRLVNIRSYLRRNKVDAIHFLFTPTKMNAFFFKMLIPFKKYKTIQSAATLDLNTRSPQELRKILFADQIVTYSNFSRKKLLEIGITNVKTIYPGIDIKRFTTVTRDQDLQSKLGLKDDDFVIIYPGEYTRLGATQMLIDALPRLVEEIPNLKFILACRFKYPEDYVKHDEIIEFTSRSGLDEHLIHTGTIEDMPALYSLADIVVFPAVNMDGKFDVPLAVIEAMASGKPVVVSDLPVLAEFANDNNAMMVKAGDAEDYRNKLLQLCANSELRDQLATDARHYIMQHYDIDKAASQYDDLYQDLLES